MITKRVSLRSVSKWWNKTYSTAATALRPAHQLHDLSLPVFRKEAFIPAIPALLPRGAFSSTPAIQKWFLNPSDQMPSLDTSYLKTWGSAIVPVEITDGEQFSQVHQPLQFFLDASEKSTKARIYLAQASLADLPDSLREDVPTPELVSSAGKGDVYDTSIWLGQAPTYTPLHRDPNPNLFVQLAGKKRVRLFKPDLGAAIFHHVQSTIGGTASATMRGAEMMEGAERRVLEEAVWGAPKGAFWEAGGLECEVGPGDGLFIPRGWWHSIKGIGQGMTGSVNWWFR